MVLAEETKNLPAASLITVTEEGAAGRARDHFTFTAPIFGRCRRPLASRRDCWSTTADTSPSQDRSAVRFASVIRRVDS